MKMLNDVERVDISLLSGQILKMKVSNVESVTLFHVQLLSASKCENIIHNYMADKNTEVSFSLNTSDNKLQIATIYLLYTDHKCYQKIRKIILLNHIQITKYSRILNHQQNTYDAVFKSI